MLHHNPHQGYTIMPISQMKKIRLREWKWCAKGDGDITDMMWSGIDITASMPAVPGFFGTRDQFYGRQLFHGWGSGDGFRMIQAHYIYCALVARFGKESACSAGDPSSIPGSGRSPGGGHGNPLQYSCLGNLMDRGAWWAMVHSIAKSQTRLKKLSITHTHTENSRYAQVKMKSLIFLIKIFLIFGENVLISTLWASFYEDSFVEKAET